MATLSFWIGRNTFYRTLGPIIEAALGDSSWEVVLVLGPSVAASGEKHHQTATPESIPPRLKGRCRTFVVTTLEELADRLNRMDIVIAVTGRDIFHKLIGSLAPRALWCAVFDADHSTQPSHHFGAADLNGWPSRYYLDWAIESGVGTREHLERLACEIGYVRTDPLRWSDPRETKRAWGVDPGRPTVLYVPDGYRLTRGKAYVTDWYQHVWCIKGRLERLARAFIFRRSWRSIREALEASGSHARMMRVIRLFCDRNQAQLVMVKRRRKNWAGDRAFTEDELEAADHIIEEDEQYPQTLPCTAQMADLVICSYRSGVLLDVLAAGIPHITIGLPSRANTARNEAYAQRFDREQAHHPGATWLIPAEEFLRSFGGRSLAEFAIDSLVQRCVQAKYVGEVDGRCSKRLLQAIRVRLGGREASVITRESLEERPTSCRREV